MASGAFPRLVFVHPILPDVEPQERQPGLIAFQGMANATFGFVQTQSHLGPPGLEQLLSVFKPLAVLVQHHAIIGVGDNPSLRVELGDSLMPTCRAISANSGEQLPPWGVPAVVGLR